MPELDPTALKLQPRHLKTLLELIGQYFPQAQIWAYGSRINGDCHEASDLDLVARNPTALDQSLSDLFDFQEVLVESNLPIRIDVVDWAQIPESFQGEIERGDVEIWKG
ncbi:MAG: nucleotidyltransferase domain-containing protein [Thermodesulfobacteriota bacterium]|nr:nucleotidyltransferase domain-containing protein [Thermodesulfobacteriota bacterium]